MPDSDTLYTSNSNVTIPGYAINVSVEIAGAQGAGGGSDAGASAGSGGAGRKGIVYFPDYTARTLTLTIGGQGGAGNGCVANSGAGGGGSNGGGGGGNAGPNGCSGGGGGGGGYTAIYDNFHNAYVAVAAGGGGGGGASWNASATNGGNGGSFSAYSSTITPVSGNGGSSCPNDGGGGGGGGGGATAGGGGYEGYDNNRGGGGGGGGGSGYRSSYVSVGGSSGTTNYGNGYARVRYDIGSPEITTFTVSPTAIIRGQNATLTWSITNASSAEISNQVGAVSVPTGTATITPDFTTTYTLTAYGPGGTTDTASVPITVYIPPVLNLTLDSSSIIVNGSTTLRWTTTGDADTIYWVQGGITNTNLDSNEPVSPSVTTTYSAYVSGLGGLSPLATVILYVYYPPTLNVDYPTSIIYGQQALIEYSGDYADTSVTISATYNYDYIGTTTDPVANLNTASSAEFGPDSGYSGEYNTNIVYNDRGPLSVTYVITATGQGGTISQPFTIPIIVDDTPDNITIPESGDLLKDQEPVTTPDTEVLSEMILIDGVDIQVEIKASDPVNVDVNANDDWTKIRQIGTPPAVQGNSIAAESFDVRSASLEEPPTFDVETSASTSFSWSGGATSISIIKGESATYSWSASGGYSSCTLNGAALTASGSSQTYNVQNVNRYFSPSPAPGDHICNTSSPGGSYSSEGVLFKAFTSQAPGTFGAYDQENPGVKPSTGLLGYVYPSSASPPVSTTTIYEKIDPNGGPPAGFGTIWTTSSGGEGPYTLDGPNGSFKTPTTGYTDYSGLSWSGSSTITPTSSGSYTLVASGGGQTTSTRTISITVYIPPTISFTSSLGTTIVAGQSTIIYWTTAGDADTITWTQGDITNTNLNSNSTVSPSDTSTYCAKVSGLGGTSPVTCITITVKQVPTGSLTVPETIDYGVNFNIGYDTQYATNEISIVPTYVYLDGTTVTGTTINRTVASGDELGDPDSDTVRTGVVPITVPWNDFGPTQVTFALTATGGGGSAFVSPVSKSVNIDQTPANIVIPESDGLLKDANPVITPDTTVVSEMYLIDDIDIPVEIKASDPIDVNVNGTDNWEDVRQLGGGVGGNSFPTKPGVYHVRPSSNLDEPPTYELQTQVTFAELASLVTCVSVIDETSGSAYSNNQGLLNNCWSQNPPVIGGGDVDSRRGFRTAFPYRSFYLLDPGGPNNINLPANWSSDAYAYGPIGVNRDNGNAGSRSDWFTICNFQSLPYGTIVSIWIDVSGSMTLSTVQASYDYFLQRCAAAGIEIVLSLSASGERYIEGHIQYLPPSANFTAEDSDGNTTNIQVIAGEDVYLSWVVFGDATNLEVTPGVLSPTSDVNQFVKTVTVNPEDDTTYTLSAQGPAGITSRTITIEVLVPPTITLTSSAGDTLLVGQCTTISWSVQGDGSSIAWTTGDIDNTNLSSSAVVCPVDTFTYCAVASGPGGVSPETCITIYVKQPPSASITVPAQIDYGQDFNIEYETKFADDSISIVPTYQYLDGTSVTGTSINPSAAASAELSDPDTDTVRDGTVPIIVPWNDYGPFRIDFVITANGTGGTATDFDNTSVNIDQTPVNFTIEESDENLKDAEPVYTPDTEILSEMYLIDDIDIPVEIKASDPIKVDINKNDNWEDVRRI